MRLIFARKYKSWTSNDWRSVIFSDETKINLINPDCGKIYVKAGPNSKMKKETQKRTIKHGGGNVKL